LLAVAGNVGHADRVELAGDPALALQVQGIQNLSLHLTLLQHACCLDQPIGERRLAVVDVRDNAEVANMIELQVGSFGLCWRQRRERRNITATDRSPPAKKEKGPLNATLFFCSRLGLLPVLRYRTKWLASARRRLGS